MHSYGWKLSAQFSGLCTNLHRVGYAIHHCVSGKIGTPDNTQRTCRHMPSAYYAVIVDVRAFEFEEHCKRLFVIFHVLRSSYRCV